MSRRAFITRNISPSYDFFRILTAEGWEVNGESLVRLTPIPFEEIPESDWIFFSSGYAVRFFFNQIKSIPDRKWAAIGAGTATSLSNFIGRPPDFMGNGNPGATAAPFRRQARGEKVLFPGALNSRQSVQMAINSEVETISIAIYDNQPVENPSLRTESVLAFTSPMNAQSYFSIHPLHRRQFVAAIGNSTAEAILKLGVQEVTVAAEATEKGLAEAVLSIRAW